MDNFKVEYVFKVGNASLDEILISILNLKIKNVDLENKT